MIIVLVLIRVTFIVMRGEEDRGKREGEREAVGERIEGCEEGERDGGVRRDFDSMEKTS